MLEWLWNPKTLFILSVWALFFLVFLGSVKKDKVSQKQPLRLTSIFFLCCIAFTFWGEASELALDQFFNRLPVALLVKYCCLIGVAHLFNSLLNDVKPNHSLIPIKYFSYIAIFIGIISFIVYVIYKPLPIYDVRFLYIGGRDAVVLIYAIVSFIPGTLAMRHDEAVTMMRTKLNLILLMTFCFMITALGSVIAAILAILKIGDPVAVASTVQPFVVLGIIFFVLIMVPYQRFSTKFDLKQLYTYYRLRNLEIRLLNLQKLPTKNSLTISTLLSPKALKLAIYRRMISILDIYPNLLEKDLDDTLYTGIKNCIETTPNYDDLVRKLSYL